MRNHNRQMVALILSRGTVHGDKRAGIDFVTRTALHIAALNDDAGEVNIQLNMCTAPNALAKVSNPCGARAQGKI